MATRYRDDRDLIHGQVPRATRVYSAPSPPAGRLQGTRQEGMKRVWIRLPGSGPPLQPQIPTSSARSHHLGRKSPSSEPTHDAHLILGGLRRLKHAMFLSAFASLYPDPLSRPRHRPQALLRAAQRKGADPVHVTMHSRGGHAPLIPRGRPRSSRRPPPRASGRRCRHRTGAAERLRGLLPRRTRRDRSPPRTSTWSASRHRRA